LKGIQTPDANGRGSRRDERFYKKTAGIEGKTRQRIKNGELQRIEEGMQRGGGGQKKKKPAKCLKKMKGEKKGVLRPCGGKNIKRGGGEAHFC